MRIFVLVVAASMALVATGCGATTQTTTTTVTGLGFPVLRSATATFISREHGKDKDSALTVQDDWTFDLQLMTRFADGYDVAVVFSQDHDLSEVADEIKLISSEQRRWIKMIPAFPYHAGAPNMRGINHTDWLRIDKATYDSCLDPFDYRAAKATT